MLIGKWPPQVGLFLGILVRCGHRGQKPQPQAELKAPSQPVRSSAPPVHRTLHFLSQEGTTQVDNGEGAEPTCQRGGEESHKEVKGADQTWHPGVHHSLGCHSTLSWVWFPILLAMLPLKEVLVHHSPRASTWCILHPVDKHGDSSLP